MVNCQEVKLSSYKLTDNSKNNPPEHLPRRAVTIFPALAVETKHWEYRVLKRVKTTRLTGGLHWPYMAESQDSSTVLLLG